MYTSVRATAQRTTSSDLSMVTQKFRKGFEIPLIPYQKHGILSKVLWASKNHIVRIIPGYDTATGEVFRQNVRCNEYSTEDTFDNYLSGTFCMASVADKFGSLKYPIITDYRPGSPDEQAYAGDTVLRNFIRGIMYACSAKGHARLKPVNEWKAWTAIGPGSTLAYEHQSLLMQTLAFQVNGRNNQDMDTHQDMLDENGEVLPMLVLCAVTGKQSINNIMQALVDPMNPALPLDAATNNKFGPLAELDGNKLFLNTYVDNVQRFSALRPSVQAPGPGTGWTPVPFPLTEDDVHQLWHPWEDLLYYMDAQEQLALCAREFGKDTVNYVIGTDPKFARLPIPDDIAQAGFGKYAGLVGGSVSYETHQTPAAASPGGFGRGLGRSQQPAAQAPAFGSHWAQAQQPAAQQPSTQQPSMPPFTMNTPEEDAGQPVQQPAHQAQRPAWGSAARPAPAGSGVNVQQVMQQVQAIRAAARMAPPPQPTAQADAASELLGEDVMQEG